MKKLRTRFLKTPKLPLNLRTPPAPETHIVAVPGRSALAFSGEPTSSGTPTLSAPRLTGQPLLNKLRFKLSWSEVTGASEYVLERTELTFPSKTELSSPRWDGPRGPRIGREVYRGPDRSYWDDLPHLLMWPLKYRVRADASGRAGEWSDPLRFLPPQPGSDGEGQILG